MPELRTDWLTGRTVIVAENRANRPNEFAASGEAVSATGRQTPAPTFLANCPFCAGNEHHTPRSIYQQTDDRGRWKLRVVPNMFPAVELAAAAVPANQCDSAQPAIGAHEVIIESARHADRMSNLTAAELRDALVAYAERLNHWHADGRFRYGLLFKNQGPRAARSLSHVHSQLISLPQIPPAVEREFARAKSSFEQSGSCPTCRLLQDELANGERIVFERYGYVAFCPFASLQPLEVWLLPMTHEPWFERPSTEHVDGFDSLSQVLHDLVGRLETLVPGAAYNMILRTAPWQAEGVPWCHWRIELLPRIADWGGLEMGAGVNINPLPPEVASQRLRGQ